MKLSVGDLSLYCHFALATERYGGDVVMLGFFDRSKIKVQAAVQNLGKRRIKIGWMNYTTNGGECDEWTGGMHALSMGRERFTYCCAVSRAVGKRWLLTTSGSELEDFYNYLMNNFKLPLLKQWTLPILSKLVQDCIIREKRLYPTVEDAVRVAKVRFEGNLVDVRDFKCFDLDGLNNDALTKVVSELLRDKVICITQKRMKPLEFSTFDEYVNTYGPSLVDNLNKSISPLVDLKPNVDTVAFKDKKLYPQQAACVNGVIAMKNHGINYAILNEGMGVGKSLQSLAAMEGIKVDEYLKSHPGATLRDAYQPGAVNYRAIIMAPGHLVGKWATEIEKEVPYASVTIVQGLSSLVELKAGNRKPRGREFYVISKDSAKLDTLYSPIPTRIKYKRPALRICTDCRYDEDNPKIVYQKGRGNDAYCPQCHGKNFEPYIYGDRIAKVLVCPECGEALIRFKNYNPDTSSFKDSWEDAPMMPKDFSSRKEENSFCYHCGSSLWSVKPKNLTLPGDKPKKSKWYRVTHFSNHTHKTKASAFVLNGYENDYLSTCTTTEGLQEVANECGPRRTSVARFIKKQLKGYFDFCVLDECHKYFGESAQSVAAHQLVKASKFSLGLTGTISNGTAKAFYNLFFMFEPKKLLDMGYKYSSGECTRFCKEYGCVEQLYECSSTSSDRNVMSRGKSLGAPKVKPGISPVIFGRLLMDRCLFLDISDLSKYLPRFSESVEIVDAPTDILSEYYRVADTLKEESQRGAGMALLSTMLQFCLSYLDKPYGRLPIMDPFEKGSMVIQPDNFEEYSELDTLTPKEARLIEIVSDEIAEGRNCFIYPNFTNNPETNVCYRLKELIESKCNLKGRVEIIQSSSPAASKREEWFHKRASEGIKVFISNPQNVETGLDFCFEYKGKYYNYPTLIFYQTGYNLSVVWQASRRAFRLNQKQECRNYYLAYNKTLQATALEIMAKKQVATAAIQGCFSTEGLSAMAKGVDARAQLAAALSKGDVSDRKTLENMFDTLNSTVAEEDERYNSYVPSPSFYEVMGYAKEEGVSLSGFGSFDCIDALNDSEIQDSESISCISKFGSFVSYDNEAGNDFRFSELGSFGSYGQSTRLEEVSVESTNEKKKARAKKSDSVNQSIFDILDELAV